MEKCNHRKYRVWEYMVRPLNGAPIHTGEKTLVG